MKPFKLSIVLVFIGLRALGQTEDFKLTYHIVGLGSNAWRNIYPIVKINGTTLTYTIEQQTTINKIKKWRNIVDTIWNTTTVDYSVNLEKKTIDTIFNLVKNIKDTFIFKSNHCIMSGAVDILSISASSFKVEYQLMNTSDSTVLLISNILNYYLPDNNKIWTNPDFMKERNDCDMYFDNRIREDEKSKTKKSKSGL